MEQARTLLVSCCRGLARMLGSEETSIWDLMTDMRSFRVRLSVIRPSLISRSSAESILVEGGGLLSLGIFTPSQLLYSEKKKYFFTISDP